MPPRSSEEEERDEWLSADYHRRRYLLCIPVQPKRPRHAPEQAPLANGQYGALRDKVSEKGMERDIGSPDGDRMEDFGISPSGGSASRSRRQRKEDQCVEGVRPGVLGRAYVEKARQSRLDFGEEMDVAAVGTHRGRRWEPLSTSQTAFMVSKASDAAVWEDLKDISPPMEDGNPLKLHRFLEKLDNWGITVTEEVDPPAAEKCVFKRF